MKTKSIVAGIILSVALAAPFAASALSVDELQQQIKNLLAKVSSLQLQMKQQQSASSTAIAMPAPAPTQRICAVINRNLSRGSTGNDVQALQDFLYDEGFMTDAKATGYFGSATARALAKWQTKNSIAARGLFGPMSRERIRVWCGDGGNGLMNVSPNKGTAPLTVTITARTGDASDYRPSMADGRDTMIDFGDGSERQWVHCAVTAQEIYPARCQSVQSFSHTYTADGTYTVSLLKSGGMCVGGCGDQTLSSEKVTVGTTQNVLLNATPQSGTAPLTVTFTTSVGINSDVPAIDFGDGVSASMMKGSCIAIMAIKGGQGGIRCSMTATHTYTQNGSYTAKLLSGSTDQAVITVGADTSNGTLSADPQSGAAPLPVSFAFHPTEESGAYWIEYGDGEGQLMNPHPIYCIRAPCISPFTSNHTYQSAGTYDVYVTSYIVCMHSNPRCMIATVPLAKTTITVNSGSGSGAPVISSFSGPTLLSVNEIGTWKITATDPENGTLNYSILWGDEWTATDASAKMMAPTASIQQNTSFTHSYATAGNYTVALTVKDADGKEARTTATVQVSQTACTAQYQPVCGRPNGCANTCAPGMMCTMQCQLYQPQTYSNRCALNNSNATFMHDGACTGNEGYLN